MGFKKPGWCNARNALLNNAPQSVVCTFVHSCSRSSRYAENVTLCLLEAPFTRARLRAEGA
eukprot:1205360-Prorocentrum_lima.AAC.1